MPTASSLPSARLKQLLWSLGFILYCSWSTQSLAQDSVRSQTIRTLFHQKNIERESTKPITGLTHIGHPALPYPPTETFDLRSIPEIEYFEFFDYVDDESSIQHIGELVNLQSLRIGYLAEDCRVQGEWLRHLNKLQKLKSLTLCISGLRDEHIHHITALKNLEEIDLQNIEGFSDESVKALLTLPHLKKLSIGGELTDDLGSAIAQHAKLEILEISGQFSDQFLKDLSQKTNFRELSIGSTKITDRGVEHILKSNSCTQVQFNSQLLTDRSIEAVVTHRELTGLFLESPLLTDACTEQLAALPKLEALALRGSALTDQGVIQLCQSQSLQRLFVEGSKRLTTACIPAALQAKSLDSLDLRFTAVPPEEMAKTNRLLDAKSKK